MRPIAKRLRRATVLHPLIGRRGRERLREIDYEAAPPEAPPLRNKSTRWQPAAVSLNKHYTVYYIYMHSPHDPVGYVYKIDT